MPDLVLVETTVDVQIVEFTVEVGGVPGPAGAPGTPGGGIMLQLDYNDATPVPVLTLPPQTTVALVRLAVLIPFDGTGAALTVGTAGTPSLLMAATDNQPAVSACYESTPGIQFDSSTPILATIVPGAGATQGRAVLFLPLASS